MPAAANWAHSTPVSATRPCCRRTASEPSMLLWKLPPHRLNASASAWRVVAPSRPMTRAAAAVAPKTAAIPVGSNPSYISSVRLKRAPTSAPAATATNRSAPERPPASSAAASAAGTTDDPTWTPGAIASQKSSARHIVPLSSAVALAGSRSPNTNEVASGRPPRSTSNRRSSSIPSSPAPAMPVASVESTIRCTLSRASAGTSAALSPVTNSTSSRSAFTTCRGRRRSAPRGRGRRCDRRRRRSASASARRSSRRSATA